MYYRDHYTFSEDIVWAITDIGLQVEAEVFIQGSYLDIGSLDDLVQAVHHLTSSRNSTYPFLKEPFHDHH